MTHGCHHPFIFSSVGCATFQWSDGRFASSFIREFARSVLVSSQDSRRVAFYRCGRQPARQPMKALAGDTRRASN
jgi:hypothetical protein